jgi:hypothetical protein
MKTTAPPAAHLSRRHFLRGAGSLIALPPLLSLLDGPRLSAVEPGAAAGPPPKRLVFIGIGFGVTNETWFPDTARTGPDYTLPPGLAPLARHQREFTVVQGCQHRFSSDPHAGSTFWLTGANIYGVAGQSFNNSVSADQVAAARFGKETRFTSLQLCGAQDEPTGHGPGLSLAWDDHGKPLPGLTTPTKAFHALFSADDTPLDQRRAQMAQQRSVLDTVLADVADVSRGLNRTDADKVSEYLQSIRDVETRLSKEERWFGVTKPKPPVGVPREGLSGHDEIRAMYDLIIAALQTDSTRVATYRMPLQSLLTSLGVKVAAHDMSHYSPGDRMDASQKRDVAQSELLAGFIDRLKATKEHDGSTLFDHTAVAFGSNLRSVHYLDNCPTLLTGGGAGIRLGQHVVLSDRKTPLCNVWLTLLNGVGIDVDRHGDSTGVVKELKA